VRVRSEIIPQKDRAQDAESLQIRKSQVSVPRAAIRISLLALSGNAAVTGTHHLVNSERIKARFGSYHVQVLHQDAATRLASLCSRHDDTDICRTLAVTRFASPTPATLAEADALIRQGDSIGSTLERAGQHLSREIIVEASVPCGEAFTALTGQTVKRGDLLSLRLYRLDAGPDPEALMPYATIAEAHHPEHIPASDEAVLITELGRGDWGADAELALEALLTALQ